MTSAPPRGAALADWLAYQERLHPRSIDLGLARVGAVAARLGLLDAPPLTLTIAGTNGKGSSATLAALICGAAGYRTGLYTSPHLLRYNERIVIDGVQARDDALCEAFEAIEQARGDTLLTYFEFGTLAALWLFRRAQVQVQVLEVGLGGRLDAVNLIDADCAVVTNIGLDHTDWLGPDRESIGAEKAGIFRAGRAAVCVDPDPPASLLRLAGADLRLLGRDFRIDAADAGGWDWHGRQRSLLRLPPPALHGAAQLRNAAGVLAALEALEPRLAIPEAAIRAALPRLALPGRFERRGHLIYDVAHNVEAAAVLADNLREARVAGKIHLVLGMLADKPVEPYCATLAPWVACTYFAGLPPPRGLAAPDLAARAAEGGLRGSLHESVSDAIAAARAHAQDGDTILVCGSFLTVAAAQAEDH